MASERVGGGGGEEPSSAPVVKPTGGGGGDGSLSPVVLWLSVEDALLSTAFRADGVLLVTGEGVDPLMSIPAGGGYNGSWSANVALGVGDGDTLLLSSVPATS